MSNTEYEINMRAGVLLNLIWHKFKELSPSQYQKMVEILRTGKLENLSDNQLFDECLDIGCEISGAITAYLSHPDILNTINEGVKNLIPDTH